MRNLKSTHVWFPLVDRLKSEGHDVEMIFFNDVPTGESATTRPRPTSWCDMLTVGFFGANVREAMMLGKPVICYLRPEWLESMRREVPGYVDEIPVVSATPETAYDDARDLMEIPNGAVSSANRDASSPSNGILPTRAPGASTPSTATCWSRGDRRPEARRREGGARAPCRRRLGSAIRVDQRRGPRRLEAAFSPTPRPEHDAWFDPSGSTRHSGSSRSGRRRTGA